MWLDACKKKESRKTHRHAIKIDTVPEAVLSRVFDFCGARMLKMAGVHIDITTPSQSAPSLQLQKAYEEEFKYLAYIPIAICDSVSNDSANKTASSPHLSTAIACAVSALA